MPRQQYTSLEAFVCDLPELLSKSAASLQGKDADFLLKTKDGRRWAVLLKDGRFTVLADPDQGRKYDCTAEVDAGVLLDIINGKTNAVIALLTRKIRAEGNVTKLMPLLKLL